MTIKSLFPEKNDENICKKLEEFGASNNMPDIENMAQSFSGEAAKIKYRLTLS
jgi:hypothetical protein